MALGRLIDSSYFINEISIPNIDRGGVSEKLGTFISKYQKKILLSALGHDLYYNLDANYDVFTTDKWYELVHGAEYTIDIKDGDYKMRWNGLVNSDKESLIAYYTFFYLLKDHQETFFGTGIATGKGKNVIMISPKSRYTKAWNEMIELYGLGSGYDINRWLIYGYDSPNEMACELGDISNLAFDPIYKPTLYNFITAKNNEDNTTYPNWIFTRLERKNIMSL